jgi:hypothetical protein
MVAATSLLALIPTAALPSGALCLGGCLASVAAGKPSAGTRSSRTSRAGASAGTPPHTLQEHRSSRRARAAPAPCERTRTTRGRGASSERSPARRSASNGGCLVSTAPTAAPPRASPPAGAARGRSPHPPRISWSRLQPPRTERIRRPLSCIRPPNSAVCLKQTASYATVPLRPVGGGQTTLLTQRHLCSAHAGVQEMPPAAVFPDAASVSRPARQCRLLVCCTHSVFSCGVEPGTGARRTHPLALRADDLARPARRAPHSAQPVLCRAPRPGPGRSAPRARSRSRASSRRR